ncbi:aminoglycoside N(3)-acetyltransferase [Streptomyces goshikiensis]|uniref:aminoglycoside N(3)-acetyltransferase n=1 Tax=Streptomyces goshikiensis TaxID=1942 RepID=UPI0036B06572
MPELTRPTSPPLHPAGTAAPTNDPWANTSISPLTATELTEGWHELGIQAGMTLIMHSSLSSLGWVEGGATTVVDSLRTALGPSGTLTVPTYTLRVGEQSPTYRAPHLVGFPNPVTHERRTTGPVFHPNLPSETGAIPEAVRALPESIRTSHPCTSFTAIGAHADAITSRQTLGFAVGRDSPLGCLHDLHAHILLVGVGHNRNSFLHYAEYFTPHPRFRLWRFPIEISSECVWTEVIDMGADNNTHFPTVGRDFEQNTGIQEVTIGNARCRLIPVQEFIPFAITRLAELATEDEKIWREFRETGNGA